jgi:hypothetical protein
MADEMTAIPADEEITREAHELVQQTATFVTRACARAKQLPTLNQAVWEGARFRVEITMPPDATLVAVAELAAGPVTFFKITLPDVPAKFDA